MTLDDLVDPKFHSLVTVARRLIEERCARGVASPAEQLAGVALAEQPDEGDEAAVRAWQPTSQFRAAVRLVATATLALARRCTDRGWSGPGDMGARYARRPDGVRCRVPPASHRLAAVLACWSVVGAGCSSGTAIRCALTDLLTDGPGPQPADTRTVAAAAETAPVVDACDADDPAVWVNEANPEASLIVATNKLRGFSSCTGSTARSSRRATWAVSTTSTSGTA